MRNYTKISKAVFIGCLSGFIICFIVSCGGTQVTVQPKNPSKTKEQIEAEKQFDLKMKDLFAKAEQRVGRGQYSEALALIQPIIEGYPGTVYTDQAYFMKGMIFADMLNFNRNVEKAAASFRMVIASEPVTEFDKYAQEMLLKIKK